MFRSTWLAVEGLLSLLSINLLILASATRAVPPLPYDANIDNGKGGSYPVLPKFASSELRAPRVNFETWTSYCDDGLNYFITPRGWKVKNPGPMILDPAGNLIWAKHFDNEFGGQAYDFKVQQYHGEQVLTFWLGDDTVRGHGKGHYYILNSSYDVIHKVGAANGLFADLHDFVITPDNTALMTIFSPKSADVIPFGRKFNDLWNQAAWDGIVQEVDLETGAALFEWRASEHISMNATYHKLESSVGEAGTRVKPFDWFHINSVQKDELGNFLISARNVHAIYYIDGETGAIIWTLGGKYNSFHDLSGGQALRFAWQHDARFVSTQAFPETYKPRILQPDKTERLFSIFDNAAMDFDHTYGTPYSRVLILEVSYPTTKIPHKPAPGSSDRSSRLERAEQLSPQDTSKFNDIDVLNSDLNVRVVAELKHPRAVRSGTQGSVQVLPSSDHEDAKVFAGYGINAVMSTFSSNGTVLCDAHFGAMTSWDNGDVQSYRAFKFPWSGRPSIPPVAVMRWAHFYVSWNGATEVKTWLLQATDDTSKGWQDVQKLPKDGFESTISLQELDGLAKKYYRFVALDSESNICVHGTSNVIEKGYVNSFTRPRMHITKDGSIFTYVLFVFLSTAALWLIFRLRRSSNSRASHTYIPLTHHGRPD